MRMLTHCLFLPACASELEWKLSDVGAVKTTLEENPLKKREIADVMEAALRRRDSDSDCD